MSAARWVRRRTRRARRWAVYALVRLLAASVAALPRRLALALGRGLGGLAFHVAAAPRRRALAQIERALSVPPATARQIGKGVFSHLGQLVVELALAPKLRSELDRYVELPEPSRALLEATLAEGRGALVVTGHVGNWELLAQRAAAAGFDVATFARAHPNPFLGAWLVRLRAAAGVETIDRGDPGAARQLLRVLRRGALLGVLIDQDIKARSAFVPFFGRPASTPTVAAELALRRQIPLLLAFIERRPGGHQIRVERLEPEAGEDAARLTARLTQKIEAEIRARPEQWVWVHDRWKRQPELPPPRSAELP